MDTIKRELPPASLLYFVANVATHARIALGEIPNPVTRDAVMDLDAVRHCIDLLEILEEKTEGNRTDDETAAIENMLQDLRLKYISVANES